MVQQGNLTMPNIVTTSSELSSSDLQVLISDEKNLIVVKSNYSVAIYCSKTTRLVAKVFKDDKILCIWLKNDKVSDQKIFTVNVYDHKLREDLR